MWSISHLKNCLSVSATTSSQYMAGMRTDRLEGQEASAEILWNITWYSRWHCWCSFSVYRMTMALCQGSFWGSIASLLVWQQLMSPLVCQLMACWQSLHLGHLQAQSAPFLFPVKMEQQSRKCRAYSDAPYKSSLLTSCAGAYKGLDVCKCLLINLYLIPNSLFGLCQTMVF